MGRWMRLTVLLAGICGAGILIVHFQTSIVTTGYRLTNLIEKKEGLREKNRMLRIENGRAGVPEQVRKSWEMISKDCEPQDRSEPGPGEACAGRRDGVGTEE